MLEAATEVAHCAGELRLDAVPAAARRGGMVSLVENQQAAGKHRSEPRAHRVGVGRVGKEIMRDEKPAVRVPRVDAEAALAPHLREVVAVEDLENETETLVKLCLPLLKNRRGSRYDDRLGLLTQQQFAGDRPA